MDLCLIAEFERDKITMGRIEAKICSVCDKNPSKYRCPYCSAHYCSLACNKVHKSGAGTVKSPCTGKRQLVEASAQSADYGGQTPAKQPKTCDSDKDAIVAAPEEETPATAGCLRNARDQWRGGKIEENEEEEWRMSEDQRKRLSQCEWLKTALRDPKLQALLVEIDKANDRKKTLAFHRTSTQFGEFMDKLLLEIGEYRKGGLDEPALVAADA